MVPIANFYLGASSPATAHFSNRPLSMSQASLPRSPASPQPNSGKATPSSYRASMPPPSRNQPPETPGASPFVNQQPPNDFQRSRHIESTTEENEDDPELHTAKLSSSPPTDTSEKRKSRGMMNKDFKFPSPTPTPTTPQFVKSSTPTSSTTPTTRSKQNSVEHTAPVHARNSSVATPSAIEVPAPPPVEKESSMSTISLSESTDDDIGATEEISLN